MHRILLRLLGSCFPWRWKVHYNKSEVIKQNFCRNFRSTIGKIIQKLTKFWHQVKVSSVCSPSLAHHSTTCSVILSNILTMQPVHSSTCQLRERERECRSRKELYLNYRSKIDNSSCTITKTWCRPFWLRVPHLLPGSWVRVTLGSGCRLTSVTMAILTWAISR